MKLPYERKEINVLPRKYNEETWPEYLHTLWWNFGGRQLTFWWQRSTRGFDDSDTWSLDYTICKFTAPRLRHLAATTHGYPSEFIHGEDLTEESLAAFDALSPEERKQRSDEAFAKWQETICKMARAMEIWVENECWYEPGSTEETEWKEGMDLFFKYFFALWD